MALPTEGRLRDQFAAFVKVDLGGILTGSTEDVTFEPRSLAGIDTAGKG